MTTVERLAAAYKAERGTEAHINIPTDTADYIVVGGKTLDHKLIMWANTASNADMREFYKKR